MSYAGQNCLDSWTGGAIGKCIIRKKKKETTLNLNLYIEHIIHLSCTDVSFSPQPHQPAQPGVEPVEAPEYTPDMNGNPQVTQAPVPHTQEGGKPPAGAASSDRLPQVGRP